MIYPLKSNWKVDEDAGFVPDQIKQRVDTESNYSWARNGNIIRIPKCENIAKDRNWLKLLKDLIRQPLP